MERLVATSIVAHSGGKYDKPGIKKVERSMIGIALVGFQSILIFYQNVREIKVPHNRQHTQCPSSFDTGLRESGPQTLPCQPSAANRGPAAAVISENRASAGLRLRVARRSQPGRTCQCRAAPQPPEVDELPFKFAGRGTDKGQIRASAPPASADRSPMRP